MPIYEFDCDACGNAFDELLPMGKTSTACPQCGSAKTGRRFSTFSAHGESSPDCPAAPTCPGAAATGGCPGRCGLV